MSTRIISNGREIDTDSSSKTNNSKTKNDVVSPKRETWDKKVDFLLSIIGFAVDLGNVWRFPYVCYQNGGGAFLIPYFIMLVFIGIPLFYMELAMGQYHQLGLISIWSKICPMFAGVGYGMFFLSTFVAMYYNTIIAYAVYYTFASMTSELPWASCNNSWNTAYCTSSYDKLNGSSPNNSVSSAKEYLEYNVLRTQYSTGIDDLGGMSWELPLCIFAVYAIVYFALWKGVKSSGKVVWVTATLPYIVLIMFLIRGCMLPGAGQGILYYLTPQWEKLLHVEVWIDAAAQIFFSLGPGFGTLVALASYNKFNNNCYRDAIITSVINCMTSILAGFVVFAVLGYIALREGKGVDKVATGGPSLVFIVYPEVIATLGGSVFWSIMFFLMLISLGLDSTFGGLESPITAFCDEYPTLGRHRELFVLVFLVYCAGGSLATVTYGGQYLINIFDQHAAPYSLLFFCLIEAIAINWFYGVRRFSSNIEEMLGFRPGLFWQICWSGICPFFLLVLFILSIVFYPGVQMEGYVYPGWSLSFGWCITAVSLICVPIYIIYYFIITPGTFIQRLRAMSRPVEERASCAVTGVTQISDSDNEVPAFGPPAYDTVISAKDNSHVMYCMNDVGTRV